MNNTINNNPQGDQTEKQKKKPVLLQVLPSLSSGGVERGTVEIAKAARNAGFESFVASSGGEMVKQLEEDGIKHLQLPLASKNPITIFKNVDAIRRIIYENKVDIVHARSRAPAWSAYFACKPMNCRFVTTFHGFYSTSFPFKKLYNSVMTKGEMVVAISQFISEHMKKVYKTPEDKIRVIYRGVDMEYFNPETVDEERVRKLKDKWSLTENWPIILMPGRITRWKGQDFLLRALSRLKNMEFYCVLLGDTSKHKRYYEELLKEISLYKMEKNVMIVGSTDDMPAAYKMADVVVSASQEPEAFGRVAVEAQAMGKPVVATNLGGSKETVIHGETGRLVEILTTDEMATGIKKGIKVDKMARERIAEKARNHIKSNFSLETMAGKTLEVYRELLDKSDKNKVYSSDV